MKDHETALLIPNEILKAGEGLENDLKDKLCKLSIQDNALTIAKFVIALQNEDNIIKLQNQSDNSTDKII